MKKKNPKSPSASELEDQFSQVQAEVQKAADALRAANELSGRFGFGNLGDNDDYKFIHPDDIDNDQLDKLYDAFSLMSLPLIQEMEKCGWEISSLSC